MHLRNPLHLCLQQQVAGRHSRSNRLGMARGNYPFKEEIWTIRRESKYLTIKASHSQCEDDKPLLTWPSVSQNDFDESQIFSGFELGGSWQPAGTAMEGAEWGGLPPWAPGVLNAPGADSTLASDFDFQSPFFPQLQQLPPSWSFVVVRVACIYLEINYHPYAYRALLLKAWKGPSIPELSWKAWIATCANQSHE